MNFRLFRKSGKKQQNQVNLFDIIPIRNYESEILENGRVNILIPKFTNKFLSEFLMPRLRHPFIKVNLDEIGSTVWLEIDGKKTVNEIAQTLENKFGEKIQPIEERLSKFISQMIYHKFISYKEKGD